MLVLSRVLRKIAKEEIRVEKLNWSPQPDLNQRPSDYESPALTTELWGECIGRRL